MNFDRGGDFGGGGNEKVNAICPIGVKRGKIERKGKENGIKR